jgi:homoserine kinase
MNKESVTVFAPASVSNVGPGFDVLGFAIENLGDLITLSKRTDDQYIIEAIGADLPLDPAKNVATVALRSFCNAIDYKGGFDIKIVKKFTPGSGLGSSASSAAGTVFAANALLQQDFTREELIQFALDGEVIASGNRHADNIAPCMLGGFIAIKSCDPFDGFQIEVPSALNVLVIFPEVTIKTQEARAILPQTISLKEGILQSANMAGLITGLIRSDFELIKRSLHDVFAQPYRRKLIPFYDQVEAAAQAYHSSGFNISGSGPAMFSFHKVGQNLAEMKDEINHVYAKAGIKVRFHETRVNPRGVEIII